MMNLVMFGYYLSTQSFGDLYDVDLKSMLFEQRMKEIEDDILPFGIIDDGRDYIPQSEILHPGSGWQLPDRTAEDDLW